MTEYDKEKAKQQFNVGCLVFVGIFAAIIIFIMNAGSGNDSTTGSKVISDGENGVVNTDTYLALSDMYYDEMLGYFNAQNTSALSRMESRGNIIFLPKGTEIAVIDRGVLKTKVETVSTGVRGFVISEFIEK